MYALDLSAGARLHTLDVQTGAIKKTVYLDPTPVGQTAIGWNGSRLMVAGVTNWLMDRLVKCHPSDGGTVHLASVGSPWYLNSLDVDPSTGAVRVIAWDRFTSTELFISTMDPNSGALTLGPRITPPGNWVGMAIASAGTVVLAQGSGQKFFFLDVTTGATTLIGNLSISNSICLDLAYDSSDQLWGTFSDAFDGTNTGIYRIDLASLTATRLVPSAFPYHGLAFGRDTLTKNYCASKVSSLGCVPTLRADGIASPVARIGFTIHADQLNNDRAGMLLYSTGGRAATPFQGGLLCVAPPISRSPAGATGGTPLPALDCSGTWSIDYNDMIWNKFGGQHVWNSTATTSPFLMPGNVVQCQFWGRDPGFPAPFNSMLSDGLEFTLSP